MGPLISLRPALPSGVAAQPVPAVPSVQQSSGPVAAPVLRDAVRQSDAKPPAAASMLRDLPAEAPVPDIALASAEAARRAYIRASIAAGQNPLPLPGR